MKNGLIEKNEMSGELDAQNALTKLIQNLKFKQQYSYIFSTDAVAPESHGKCRVKCDRNLLCQHRCLKDCHFGVQCPPCEEPCTMMKCSHSKCKHFCSEFCAACTENCKWTCSHKVLALFRVVHLALGISAIYAAKNYFLVSINVHLSVEKFVPKAFARNVCCLNQSLH